MTLYTVIALGLVMMTGLGAGVFLAFSDFIMRGLRLAENGAGPAAMISINRVIYRSLFLTGFMVTTPVAATLAVWAPHGVSDEVRGLFGAGAGVYGVLVFGLTAARNVPLNKQLDASGGEASVWGRYQRVWTLWNHVRSVGAILAFGLFVLAFARLI
ncbi:DUF1772 domain-containing protein [Oceanicaulis sp. LC35]|uniref:anthrone oxygenase family protein n=1 Tax=Oceanicaulis sp. LC35 TaxID=3349635 RepID=UPI003F863158